MVCLSVTDLPLALCVIGIDSNHSDTHRTIHTRAFAIESLSCRICQFASVCGLSVPTAMHVAFVQHPFGVLLTSSADELVAVF